MYISECNFSRTILLDSHISCRQLANTIATLQPCVYINDNPPTLFSSDTLASKDKLDSKKTTTLNQHTISPFSNDQSTSCYSKYSNHLISHNIEPIEHSSELKADNTSLKDNDIHTINKTKNSSTLYHDLEPNDLELSLQAEEEIPFLDLTCQLCSKASNHIKLMQLNVCIYDENTYTYSILMVHAASQEQWLFYKKLITSNQKDPIKLFQCLIEAIEHSSNYSSPTPQNIEYMVSQTSPLTQPLLINLLSTYLGESLLETYQKASGDQDELKAITQTIQKSDLTNVFNLLLALKTKKTYPIIACPYCQDEKIVIPYTFEKSQDFYESIEPLQKIANACETQHKTKHKLYVHLPWNRNETISLSRDEKITIMITLIDSVLFDKFLSIKEKNYGYKTIYKTLEHLQSKKESIPGLNINGLPELTEYIRSLPFNELTQAANHFKVLTGIRIFDIEFPKMLKQHITPQLTYYLSLPNRPNFLVSQKAQKINLHSTLYTLKQSNCLWRTLTTIHNTLHSLQEASPASLIEEKSAYTQRVKELEYQILPLINEITSIPLNMRRIEEVTSSPHRFIHTDSHKISSKDLKEGYASLCQNNAWFNNMHKASSNVIYTLCMPWKLMANDKGTLTIDISDTHLRIVALNLDFIKVWNRVHRQLTKAPQEAFTAEILKFFFAESETFSLENSREIERMIGQHQTTLLYQIKLLLGARLANFIYFDLKKHKSKMDMNSVNYFQLNSMQDLSNALLNNKFDEMLSPDASVLTSKFKSKLVNSLLNCCLSFILSKGRSPSNHELSLLDTSRPIKRKTVRTLKRKKEDSSNGILPPLKKAAY